MTESDVKRKRTILTSWDDRPAILYPNRLAIAILAPGDFWEPVDADDFFHTAKVIATGDDFKKRFLETYGEPISSAAKWYDERGPYQDLVSMYWKVDGDISGFDETDRIKLMADLVKRKR